MKHEIYLRFCIADFDDISHEEITQRLGIIPERIYVKGQKKTLAASVLWKSNRWIMGSTLDKFSSFEDQMNSMLDLIEPKIELFKPFCEKYSCEFSLGLYIRYDNGESIPWVHLNSRYNRLIKELNVEFDVDIYCLPNGEG